MNQQSNTATSPHIRKDPVSEHEVSQWAQEDATNDNAQGSEHHFPSFNRRVQYIVDQYIGTITQGFMGDFQSRFDDLQKGLSSIAGRVMANPQTYVQEIVAHVTADIAAAEKQYAPKITALQRERAEWAERFHSGFHDGIANPKKQNVVWHWGVILFLLAVEVILNSRFFAETSEYGLLGGTMAAVVVSVVNVGLPILVGYFTHKLYYSKGHLPKYCGLFLAALLVVFAALFNYEVAEYRDQLLVDGGKLPSPLPEYFALLAIGGGIAVISFWKMFSFMDPYLRPRRCHQNREMMIKGYESAALNSIADAKVTVKNVLKDIATRVAEAEQTIKGEDAKFQFSCSEAIRHCNAMIGYYHLKYCPMKADPDPEEPELGEAEYDFSSARGLVSNRIKNLEEDCGKAKGEWQPILQEADKGLVSTQKRFQAVVVANIQAALAKAG